jgi:hypothetical protein
MNQGKRTPTITRVATDARRQTDLFHPDYTVGFGLSPNLLTLPVARQALAGSRDSSHTAGGELHPALRSSPARVRGQRRRKPHFRTRQAAPGSELDCDAASLYTNGIGPEFGIDFRKARCLDSKRRSVLCASMWMRGALAGAS